MPFRHQIALNRAIRRYLRRAPVARTLTFSALRRESRGAWDVSQRCVTMADAPTPVLGVQQAAPAAAHAPDANSRGGRLTLCGFKARVHMDAHAHPKGEPCFNGAHDPHTGALISTEAQHECPPGVVRGCLRCQVLDTVVDREGSTRGAFATAKNLRKTRPPRRLPAQCPFRSSRARRAAPQPTHYSSGDPMVLRGYSGAGAAPALPPGAGAGGAAAQPLLAQPPAPRAPRTGTAAAATQALAAQLAAQRQTEVVGGAAGQALALAQMLASQVGGAAQDQCVPHSPLLPRHDARPACLAPERVCAAAQSCSQRDDAHGDSPGVPEQRPDAGRGAGDACRRHAAGGPCCCHAGACAPRQTGLRPRRRAGWHD